MRASDYPLPSYAVAVWYARGKFFLTREGRGTFYFEDTPDGLNELRVALLAASERGLPLGAATVSGSNLLAAQRPSKRLTVAGRPKLDEGDLWGPSAEESPCS